MTFLVLITSFAIFQLGFPAMDVSSPVPVLTAPSIPNQATSHAPRSSQPIEEWSRLNYCLGEYRCSGRYPIKADHGSRVTQLIPYPGPHRHPSMFICLHNVIDSADQVPKSGGITVFRYVDKLTNAFFCRLNSLIFYVLDVLYLCMSLSTFHMFIER